MRRQGIPVRTVGQNAICVLGRLAIWGLVSLVRHLVPWIVSPVERSEMFPSVLWMMPLITVTTWVALVWMGAATPMNFTSTIPPVVILPMRVIFWPVRPAILVATEFVRPVKILKIVLKIV